MWILPWSAEVWSTILFLNGSTVAKREDKQQLLKVKIRKKTEQDIHDFFETLCCYTAD